MKTIVFVMVLLMGLPLRLAFIFFYLFLDLILVLTSSLFPFRPNPFFQKYVNHHHHHHQDNLPLLVGGLVCVLVGVAIGRSLRKKRRPCKVHHYQAVNNNNNMKKGESLVEVEEREFYPYYVTANV